MAFPAGGKKINPIIPA